MAVGIFAGIPVRDHGSALEWYRRLLGADPAFHPNDVESVRRLLEPVDVEQHGSVRKYVFHDADGNETGIGGEVPAGG